jgi:NADPH:quinone reductase-like Zn-dependent oxidoreductase
MRALVAAPGLGAGAVEHRQVDGPMPKAGHAVVQVAATSLNRGECGALLTAVDGWRPGWDLAGTVVATGEGLPPIGARVVGWVNGGAWAERVSVRADHLAPIPDDLSFEMAATLPVAGLTAAGVLSIAGSVLGKHVAITGAAGGVGRFAVQLASLAGAHVTAVVGRAERIEGLRELGARQVVVGLEPEGDPFDFVIESAGGASLAAALARVAHDGTVVTFGNSSGEPTTFDARTFYRRGAPAIVGYFVTHELLQGRTGSSQLSALASLVAEGRLRSEIGLQVPWAEANAAIVALLERRVRGKAVLQLG